MMKVFKSVVFMHMLVNVLANYDLQVAVLIVICFLPYKRILKHFFVDISLAM